MEILRDDDKLLARFGQASMSKAYSGVIKAFHYHEQQDDLWFFPVGNAQVVLYDLRADSPTRGETNVFYMGEDNPVLLVIPQMVAHGYRVLGNEPAVIVYLPPCLITGKIRMKSVWRGMIRLLGLIGRQRTDKKLRIRPLLTGVTHPWIRSFYLPDSKNLTVFNSVRRASP